MFLDWAVQADSCNLGLVLIGGLSNTMFFSIRTTLGAYTAHDQIQLGHMMSWVHHPDLPLDLVHFGLNLDRSAP